MAGTRSLRIRLARRLALPVRIPDGTSYGRDLSIRLDGHPLQVRCDGNELALSAEALGSAFLLPTLREGRRLAGGRVDPVWLDGVLRVHALARQWWGWPAGQPTFSAGDIGRPAPGVGLAFSLGVDSFHSCFFAEPSPDLLVLVGGFDPRSDQLAALTASVAEVAAAAGRDWTLVETDLRRHPLFGRLSWTLGHGAALAFVGHLLSDRIGMLQISSSHYVDHLAPHGSHPDLDPLWSSSRLRVRHVGAEVRRVDKIRRLLEHRLARELVRRHLHVCWDRTRPGSNCGRCAKCVRTRLSFELVAPDFRLETMPDDIPLPELLDALPARAHAFSLNFWRELRGGRDARTEKALEALIARCEEVMRQ